MTFTDILGWQEEIPIKMYIKKKKILQFHKIVKILWEAIFSEVSLIFNQGNQNSQ